MPYYRRNIIVLCVTVFLSSVSWNQVIPYMQLFIKGMPGVKASDSGWWIAVAAATQCFASIVAQPIWGKLGDSTGRRPMIIRAGICLAGVYFGMSLCRAPWQLVVCRFCNGALTGFIPGSFALIATNTPAQLAPRYVATAQIASNAGLIAGPMVGGLLIDRFDFRTSMTISGIAVLLSTLAVILLVREPNKTQITEKTSLAQDVLTALRSKVQLPIIVAVMMAWLYGAAISPYLVEYMNSIQAGLPKWFGGFVFALPAAAFVLTARLWSGVGERHGYHRAILIGVVGAAFTTLLLAVVPGIWGFAAVYMVVGVWLAAISPSTGALTCTRIEESFRGRAYGIQSSMGTLAALVTPLMAGYVLQHFGMRWVFVLVAGLYLIGASVFWSLARHWKTPAA